MRKDTARRLIGPTNADMARAIGVTPTAVGQWPDPLPRRIEDRVLAAVARKHLPPHLLGDDETPVLAVAPAPQPAAHP